MATFTIPFSGFGSEFELHNANEEAISKTISKNDLSSDTINTQKILEAYAKEYVFQFSILYKIPVTFKSIVFKNNMSGAEKIAVDIDDNHIDNILKNVNSDIVAYFKNIPPFKYQYNNLNMYNTLENNISIKQIIDNELIMITYLLSNKKVNYQNAFIEMDNMLINVENNIISKMIKENSINDIIRNNIIGCNNDLDEMFKNI